MTADLTTRRSQRYGAVTYAPVTPRPRLEWPRDADTLNRAWSLTSLSAEVVSRSRELRATARELVAEATQARKAFASWFKVEGTVDGRSVVGVWSHARLRCDRQLLQRALLVVDLEDAFVVGARDTIAASLEDGPLAALLTLIRACDRVTVVELSDAVMAPPVLPPTAPRR